MNITIRERKDIEFAAAKIKSLPLTTSKEKPIAYYFECTKIGIKRSVSQNKYMWFVNAFYGNELGYFADEMHYSVLAKLRQIDKIGSDGRIRKVTISTKNMNTVSFEAYMEKIRITALRFHNLLIPKPNEVPEELYRKYHKNYKPDI